MSLQKSENLAQSHRFSNFIKELSSEKKKFNSQLDYTTNETLKILNMSNSKEFESITTKVPENYYSNFLTHTVLEIINMPFEKLDKKENSSNLQSQEKTKKTYNNEATKSIKALNREISDLEIEIMKKKTNIQLLESIIIHQQKNHARKTVICEVDYNKLTLKNARNEEEIAQIENHIEEIQREAPNKEEILTELLKKRDELKEKERKFGSKNKKIEDLKVILKEKKDENEKMQEQINDLEEEFEKNASFNKKTIIFQINKKEKEVEIIINDIDGLNKRINERDLSINKNKQDLYSKIESLDTEIQIFIEKTKKYYHKKNQEKVVLEENLDKVKNINDFFEDNQLIKAKKAKLQEIRDKNMVLTRKITEKHEEFEQSKGKLLNELEIKSDLIKNNKKKIEEINIEYERLEKSLKELELNNQEAIKSGKKKIEAFKQKNKLLKNLLYNQPQENQKNQATFIQNKKDEKGIFQKQLDDLREKNTILMKYKEDLINSENDKIEGQLTLQNFENEMMEIKRLVRQKGETLKQTKEASEKFKSQMSEHI